MDKYEFEKQLGKGSFGAAYLVRNKQDGRQYVMKKVTVNKSEPKESESALQEVKLLASLKHPNIVSYHESFSKGSTLCLVMAYCEGGDLYNRIKTNKGLFFKEEQILDWFTQMALALQYIHDRRILHRDLKSQNIFLTHNSVIKLGDFGIARVLEGTLDMARTVIGTPYYMSPELFSNKPYSYKSDVWALGCVLYEMATLKHAFDAKDMNGLMVKILKGAFPSLPAHYSKDLRDLARVMLSKAPERRPRMSDILELPFIKRRIASFVNEATSPYARVPPLALPVPAADIADAKAMTPDGKKDAGRRDALAQQQAKLLHAEAEKQRVQAALDKLRDEREKRRQWGAERKQRHAAAVEAANEEVRNKNVQLQERAVQIRDEMERKQKAAAERRTKLASEQDKARLDRPARLPPPAPNNTNISPDSTPRAAAGPSLAHLSPAALPSLVNGDTRSDSPLQPLQLPPSALPMRAAALQSAAPTGKAANSRSPLAPCAPSAGVEHASPPNGAALPPAYGAAAGSARSSATAVAVGGKPPLRRDVQRLSDGATSSAASPPDAPASHSRVRSFDADRWRASENDDVQAVAPRDRNCEADAFASRSRVMRTPPRSPRASTQSHPPARPPQVLPEQPRVVRGLGSRSFVDRSPQVAKAVAEDVDHESHRNYASDGEPTSNQNLRRGAPYEFTAHRSSPRQMPIPGGAASRLSNRSNASSANNSPAASPPRQRPAPPSPPHHDHDDEYPVHIVSRPPAGYDSDDARSDSSPDECPNDSVEQEVQRCEEELKLHTTRVDLIKGVIERAQRDLDREERQKEDNQNYAEYVGLLKQHLQHHGQSLEETYDHMIAGGLHTGGLADRIAVLKRQCVAGLGRVLFERVYAFLRKQQAVQGCSGAELSPDADAEEAVCKQLVDLMGDTKTAEYWPLLDQLIFCEDSLTL